MDQDCSSPAQMQEWYSAMLIQHGADILDAVLPVMEASQPEDDTPKVRTAFTVSQM